MGKKIKKRESETHDFTNEKRKSMKKINDSDNVKVNNNQKNIKTIKRKKADGKSPRGRKNILLYIIFMRKRINELSIHCKIKKILTKLYDKKLDLLNEKYHKLVLMKYNCSNTKAIMR